MPISKINKGSLLNIPSLFKGQDFEINEILRGDIKVNGKDEITLVLDKPNIPLLVSDSDISEFFEQELFIQTSEYSEYLFGYFEPTHVFIKDDYIYITIQSDFNNFDTDENLPLKF